MWKNPLRSLVLLRANKSRLCLNTIDPGSLQNELLLRILDISVLFHELYWLCLNLDPNTVNLLKYIFCSKVNDSVKMVTAVVFTDGSDSYLKVGDTPDIS